MPLSTPLQSPPTSAIAWDRWRLPLLGLAALLIVVLPAIMLQQLFERNRVAMAVVAHTNKVQADVRELAQTMREAEESAMALALGGEMAGPRENLQAAPKRVEPMVLALMRETRDNPSQQIRLGRMKEIIDLRLHTAAQIPDMAPEDRVTAVRDLVQLYPMGGLVREALDEENALLAERRNEAEQLHRLSIWLGWGGMVVQVLLLMLVIWLLSRQVARRLRAEQEFTRAAARAGPLRVPGRCCRPCASPSRWWTASRPFSCTTPPSPRSTRSRTTSPSTPWPASTGPGTIRCCASAWPM